MKKFKLLVATLLVGVLALGLAACGGLTYADDPVEVKSQKVNAEQWQEAFAKTVGLFACQDNYSMDFAMKMTGKEDNTVTHINETEFHVRLSDTTAYVSFYEAEKAPDSSIALDSDSETLYFEKAVVEGEDVFYVYARNNESKWEKSEAQGMQNLAQVMEECPRPVASMYQSMAFQYDKFTYDNEAKGYVWVEETKEGETVVATIKTTVKIIGGYVAYIEVTQSSATMDGKLSMTLRNIGKNEKEELPQAELKTAA